MFLTLFVIQRAMMLFSRSTVSVPAVRLPLRKREGQRRKGEVMGERIDLEDVRARHQPEANLCYCAGCEGEYPCETLRLADELDSTRAALAEERERADKAEREVEWWRANSQACIGNDSEISLVQRCDALARKVEDLEKGLQSIINWAARNDHLNAGILSKEDRAFLDAKGWAADLAHAALDAALTEQEDANV